MIKVIKNEKEYKEAINRFDELLLKRPKKNTKNGNELELLSLLIDKYENEKFPIEEIDLVEAIKFRMEQMNLNRKDLEQYIGTSGRVSEVLNKKRPLSIKMMKNLYKNLHIPAKILLS